MTTFDYIYRLWPVFVAFIGSLAWLLRIEAKQIYLERTLKELSDRIVKKDDVVWNALTSLQKDHQSDMRLVLQSLSKIEGQLEKNH